MFKPKRSWRTAAIFLLVMFMVSMLVPGAAFATSAGGDNGGGSEREVPFVMFVNEPNNTPDLYVTKHVTSTEGIPIPDADFEFTVKVADKLYANEKYRVLDSNGKEVFQVLQPDMSITQQTDIEGGTSTVDFTTDRNGSFTLKAGQIAWFQFVGNGKECVVTETGYTIVGSEEGTFTQTVPAGGTFWKGTIDGDGETAEFINRYDEPEGTTKPTVPKEDETTSLSVEKTVSFPDGYEMPNSPEFVFELKIHDGTGLKPWANEPYIVFDSTGAQVEKDNTTTNENGQFSLKAGERAVFSGIPVDRDYQVSELLDVAFNSGDSPREQGWRTNGSSVKSGATAKSMAPINFHNSFASFAVSKRMGDYSKPEVEFTFRLTDGEGSARKDAQYYLYDNNKQLVSAGLFSTAHKTDDNGQFTLMPGQMAVFVGIDPGSVYNVYEIMKEGYKLETPANDDMGYTNQVVDDVHLNEHAFVNVEDKPNGALKISKNVVIGEGSVFEDNPDFTFTLLQNVGVGTAGADENGYAPVSEALYYIATSEGESSYKTDTAGTFTVKRNQTAEFRSLIPGEYKVVETLLPDGYSVERGHEDGWTVELTAEGASLMCTNNYQSYSGILPDTGGNGLVVPMLLGFVLFGLGSVRAWRKAQEQG